MNIKINDYLECFHCSRCKNDSIITERYITEEGLCPICGAHITIGDCTPIEYYDSYEEDNPKKVKSEKDCPNHENCTYYQMFHCY